MLYSLGIANIGLANAKLIRKELQYDIEKMIAANEEEISSIEGIGPVIAKLIQNILQNEENFKEIRHLLSHLELEEVTREENLSLEGKQFVTTGSVVHFANRAQAKGRN